MSSETAMELVAKAEPATLPDAAPAGVAVLAPIFGNAGGWTTVMEAAGHCCQCTGQCGATHRKTEGRCDHTHGGYGGKVRLEAAPEDLTIPEHEAARMTPDQLMAWCPPCRAGALRKARPPVKRTAPQQEESLF